MKPWKFIDVQGEKSRIANAKRICRELKQLAKFEKKSAKANLKVRCRAQQ